jgi:hypothetical protein
MTFGNGLLDRLPLVLEPKLVKLLATIAVIIVGIYIYYKLNWKASPLDKHLAEQQDMQAIGQLAQAASLNARPKVAMWGEGWGTTMFYSSANQNPYTNNPGKPRFNFRELQPSS